MVHTHQSPESMHQLRPVAQHTIFVPHRSPKHHVPSQTSEQNHHADWNQLVPDHGHDRNGRGLGQGTTDAWWIVAEVNATAAQPAPPTVRAIAPHTRVSSSSTSGDSSYGAPEGFAANAGRRSGSWGGTLPLDREFLLILGAGVDVFKHPSMHAVNTRKGVVPQRLKNLWSRESPMDDAGQGLVTLFLDAGREHLCWCLPGEAELVPDPQYVLNMHQITEVVPGYDRRERCISLRSEGRPNAFVFEVDSDELYDVLLGGFARFLTRNTLRIAPSGSSHQPHGVLMHPTPPG